LQLGSRGSALRCFTTPGDDVKIMRRGEYRWVLRLACPVILKLVPGPSRRLALPSAILALRAAAVMAQKAETFAADVLPLSSKRSGRGRRRRARSPMRSTLGASRRRARAAGGIRVASLGCSSGRTRHKPMLCKTCRNTPRPGFITWGGLRCATVSIAGAFVPAPTAAGQA
jgi:hypothetical protein